MKGKKKSKFVFCCLVLGFVVGLIFAARILDFAVKTDTVNATVTKTYEARKKHGKRVPRVNIEWTDLEGNLRTEQNITGSSELEVGDAYPIQVDAKTHSRRILSKAGNLVMFALGVAFCIGSLLGMRLWYQSK